MVSLTRRQVLIAGAGTVAVPPVFYLVKEHSTPEKLVLSGRILGAGDKPLAGATLPLGRERITTDADGRFVVVTDTHAAGSFAASAQRDSEGTWRATVGLALA